MTYKGIMDRYLKYIEKQDIQVEDITVSGHVLFNSKEIKRLYSKDLIHYPLNKRKQEIKRYFNLKLKNLILEVMEKIDYTYESSIQSVKRSIQDEITKRKRIIELYDMRDEEKKKLKVSDKKAIDEYFKEWSQKSVIDLYFNLLKDEDIFNELTEGKISTKLYEFIKEEAQDYSSFQLLMLKSIATNDSFTIVGDIGQGIYYYKGIESWQKLINEVFSGEANYIPLSQSYRSTIEIINVANRVLQKQLNYMTKGLEFDCSVIYNCDDESYGNNELEKKILYVVLTRALHMEYIFYKSKPSMLLDRLVLNNNDY